MPAVAQQLPSYINSAGVTLLLLHKPFLIRLFEAAHLIGGSCLHRPCETKACAQSKRMQAACDLPSFVSLVPRRQREMIRLVAVVNSCF